MSPPIDPDRSMNPDRSMIRIPTCRPQLPKAAEIQPFLEEIDANGWYTNFGPLVRRLEAQLADHFGAAHGSVVAVSSCTSGVSIALRGLGAAEPGLCMVPSWTFVATAMSAFGVGLSPYFVDVDRQQWALTPEIARKALKTAPRPVRAVTPVAPFGAPLDVDAWSAFSRDTGLPVVIDAAAGFDTARSDPNVVTVVSMGATKVMGIGEGGFILAGTPERADLFRRIGYFGLAPSRDSIRAGFNGKMSEYAAAVGLAALKGWPQKRAEVLETAEAYLNHLDGLNTIGLSPTFEGEFASATANVVVADGEADAAIAWLNEAGIEARRWWNRGCHRHPFLQNCPRTGMVVTEWLADSVVGIPFWEGMSEDEMLAVADRLRSFPESVTEVKRATSRR